jgi:hypothetical protein
MKTRAILIFCGAVLVPLGIGIMTAPGGGTAGWRSKPDSAKDLVTGRTVLVRPSEGGGRAGGLGSAASRNQALLDGSKPGGSGSHTGNAAPHDWFAVEGAMAEAPSGTSASRASRRKAPGNDQLSETASSPFPREWRTRLQEDFAEFFEKNALSESQKELIMNAYLERRAVREELRGQGMGVKEENKRMVEYARMQDEALRELLGDELYQSCHDYYVTIGQRKLVTDLSRQFDRIGSGMTWEQREQLIDIYRGNLVFYCDGILSERNAALRNITVTRFTKRQEAIMQESAKILNPQQMEATKQFWTEIINLPR